MVHEVKYPSLELRFLPTSFLKQLHIMPRLVYVERGGVSGYYAQPDDDERMVASSFVPENRGIICVNTLADADQDSRYLVDSLAHEVRHHWQYIQGLTTFWDRPDEQNWYYLAETFEYKEAIVKYLTLNWDELDAVLFARRFSHCPHTEEWVEWVRKHYEQTHRSRRR